MSLVRRLGGKLIPALLLGAATILALSMLADWRKVRIEFAQFHWLLVVPALGLAFSNYVIRFYRWQYYLRKLDIELAAGDSAAIFFSGLSMSVTPGKLGEVLKSYLLKRVNGTAISRSAPIVIAERFTDFVALVLLTAAGVAVTGANPLLVLVSAAVAAGVLVLVGSPALARRLLAALGRLPLIARAEDRLAVAYESTCSLLSWKALAAAMPFSVLAWFAECLAFYVVLGGFGAGRTAVGIGEATFIYAFGTLAGAVIPLPGGIGPTEGSMTGMLTTVQGLARPLAVSATFIIRACTLWFAVLVGMAVLLASQRRFHGAAEDLLARGSALETVP